MSEGELEKLRLEAFQYGTRKKLAELAGDFASYCVELAMEGRRSRLRFLYVDFMRDHFGRKNEHCRSYTWEAKANATPLIDDDNEAGQGFVPTVPEASLGRQDFHAMLKHASIRKLDRMIVGLRLIWGLELKEIGELCGLSEGRVCQIYGAAIEKVRRQTARGGLR